MMGSKRVLVASPRGFCAGVSRAVQAVEAALREHSAPVYCYHEIVHNPQVVDRLTALGAVFVTNLDEVPQGSVLLFSAHGVSPELWAEAQRRALRVVDATCPFVAKVHTEVKRYAGQGYTIILIGQRGHDEVLGVAAEAPDHLVVVENTAEAREVRVPDPERVAVVMQTTLSGVEAEVVLTTLRARFPKLITPAHSDICYATANRQDAVRRLAAEVELVLVLGARNSANSNRLVDVARDEGTNACLVPTMSDLTQVNLEGINSLGLTAGASTPESFVDQMIAALVQQGFQREDMPSSVEENVCLPAVPL